MADEQNPQQPAPAAQAPVQATSAPQPAAVLPLTFLEKLQAPIGTLWTESRFFLLVFGILILVVKFREVIISLLVDSAKRTVDNASKQSDQLKAQENQANDQANQLRQEANSLSDNQPQVGEDWNKK